MSIPAKFKIQQVNYYSENLDLVRPYTIAYETFTTVENIFVEIITQSGIMGIGAGSPAAFVTGETMAAAKGQLPEIAAFLEGKDLRTYAFLITQIHEQFPNNPSVKAAADIALHDAFAKVLDIPLVDLWGRVHQQMPTSVTIGIKSLEESIEEAKEYKTKGFKAIKLKTGKSVEEDIAVFSKIRETVGKEITIRVDANQGYSIADLTTFYEATKNLALELIEQPLPYQQFADMQQLPDSIQAICMADENLKTMQDAVSLAQTPHHFGLYNIKLMKCGGIAAGRQIAKIAELSNIGLMWGCMDESIISITAALHAAFSSPATQYLDLDGSFDLAKDVVKGGFVLDNGMLRIGEGCGLGVEKDA